MQKADYINKIKFKFFALSVLTAIFILYLGLNSKNAGIKEAEIERIQSGKLETINRKEISEMVKYINSYSLAEADEFYDSREAIPITIYYQDGTYETIFYQCESLIYRGVLYKTGTGRPAEKDKLMDKWVPIPAISMDIKETDVEKILWSMGFDQIHQLSEKDVTAIVDFLNSFPLAERHWWGQDCQRMGTEFTIVYKDRTEEKIMYDYSNILYRGVRYVIENEDSSKTMELDSLLGWR